MSSKWKVLLAVTLAISFFAVLLTVSRPARAQGGGKILARAQFRQTTDPGQFQQPDAHSTPGPAGKLLLVEDGAQQLFHAQIKQLSLTDLSIQVDTNSFYDGTNSPVFYVALLNRTGAKLGNWSRKLTGTSGAPPEFQVIGVDNLSDLSDLRSIVIGNPGSTNITGGTNFIECTQIVTNGMTITTCFTNIMGGVTNIYINAFVWAPVPQLVAKPSVFSFRVKTDMDLPSVPPSPKATGKILFKYSGSQGRSLFDVNVSGLIQGQTYSLHVSDAATNVNSGLLALTSGGSSGRYHRDTKRGDPLPLQAASTADLTGRVFTIQDAFGIVHLISSGP
jgi:hypothetical protein